MPKVRRPRRAARRSRYRRRSARHAAARRRAPPTTQPRPTCSAGAQLDGQLRSATTSRLPASCRTRGSTCARWCGCARRRARRRRPRLLVKGEDGTLGTGERGSVLAAARRAAALPGRRAGVRGSHVLALTAKGQVELGPTRTASSATATATSVPACRPTASRAESAARAAYGHRRRRRVRADALVALAADGTLYSWGCGDDGVLGHGDTRGRRAPTPIVAAPGGRAARGRGAARGHRPPRRRRALLVGRACTASSATATSRSTRPGGGAPQPAERDVRAATATVVRRPHAVWAWGWGRHGQLGLEVGDIRRPSRSAAADGSSPWLGGRHRSPLRRGTV